MSDFQVTLYEYDGSADSLNRFKQAFSAEIDRILIEKFKRAEGAYVVQGGRYPYRIQGEDFMPVDLEKGVEQGLWTKNKKWDSKQNYNSNYLIIVKIKPSTSLFLVHGLFIRPDEFGGIYFVQNGNMVLPDVSIVSGSGHREMKKALRNASSEAVFRGDYSHTLEWNENSNELVSYPEGWGHFRMQEGGRGESLKSTAGVDDHFYGYGSNTYVFFDHNWGKDTIAALGRGHRLVFHNKLPETFRVTKQGADLKIQEDNKGDNTITIKQFRPIEFSFYNGRGTEYELTTNDEGQYKFKLASPAHVVVISGSSREQRGKEGQKLIGDSNANDDFYGEGSNTYVFFYKWKLDTIYAEGSGHRLEFHGNKPETFEINKLGSTDLEINREFLGDDRIIIKKFDPKNFSFYNGVGQKYNLTKIGDGHKYKLELATK